MARQILARSVKHTPSEATTLALRRQVEFEDLAAIAERWNPVATIADVADDGIAEFEHQQRRPARDREPPPPRTSACDHPLELPARDDAPIGLAPRRIMHGRDLVLVAESRRADGYDRLGPGGAVRCGRGPAARPRHRPRT